MGKGGESCGNPAGVIFLHDPAGGEFAIKRRLESEIGHDRAAAKRSDQAQQD